MTGTFRVMRAGLACGFLTLCAMGCHGPETANIALRKQIQQLNDQVTQLQRDNGALKAQIEALQSRQGSTTRLTEPVLQSLYTTHGLSLGSLTGGFTDDANKPGDEGVTVYAVPTDDDGEPLKAAGSFTVEVFDLAAKDNNRLGLWNFNTEQTRAAWNGRALLYTFVLPCKWQKAPTHPDLLVHAQFVDELTGRAFSAEKRVTVKLP